MINANIISVLMGGGGSVPENPTLTFLKENARALWTMDNGTDKTGNGYNLVGSTGGFTETPNYKTFYDFDGTTRPVASCQSGSILLLPAGHQNLLRNSHEFHISVFSGRFFSARYLFGNQVGTCIYQMRILNTGQLQFTIRSRSSVTTTVTTTGNHWTNEGADQRRAHAQKYIRMRIDFELNTFTIWINGGTVPYTISGDGLSAWNPTYYLGTDPFGIGAANISNGTGGFPVGYDVHLDIAFVTDLLTTEQALDVTNYVLTR